MNPIKQPVRWFAELNLIVMTIFWGSSFVAMKIALDGVNPLGLVAWRFGFALIVFVMFRPHVLKQFGNIGFRYGLILAVILYFGYVLQTVALDMTTATRSAFVTSLHAAFVPLLYLILSKKFPAKSTILGLTIALSGLYFMLIKSRYDLLGFNKGDLLTVACAFAWGLYIVALPIFSRKCLLSPLIFGQLCGMAIFCWATFLIFDDPLPLPTVKSMSLIVYLAVFCTVMAIFLQSKYQKYTTSPRAAVIYTMEPVYAAALAFLVLGEMLTGREILGAAMIATGVLLSELSS